MRAGLYGAVGTILLTLCGCAGLTQVQDSLTKFDQGAHTVQSTEVSFENEVHVAQCEYQFFSRAYAFAEDPPAGLDLRENCQANLESLNSKQIQARQALMAAISLYADQLQALASTGDDKTLDSNCQATATQINQDALQHNLSKADATIADDVEAAVAGLTKMVVDQQKSEKVQAAAKAEQANLVTVVNALKNENIGLASTVNDDMASMRGNLKSILADVKNQQRLTDEAATQIIKNHLNTINHNGPEYDDLNKLLASIRKNESLAVFFDVLRVQAYLKTLSPWGIHDADTSLADNDPTVDPNTAVKQLNDALDGLVSANNAIATAGNGGVVASVNDLVARAQAAQAFQAAAAK